VIYELSMPTLHESYFKELIPSFRAVFYPYSQLNDATLQVDQIILGERYGFSLLNT
jgi:hypothetical protein